MTSSMVEIDTDVIEVLDFDYAPPCEAMIGDPDEPQCPTAGAWRVTIDCCGFVLVLCDHHFHRLLVSNGFISHTDFCNPCGGTFASIQSAEKI